MANEARSNSDTVRDALGRRIEARIRELKERGEFSDVGGGAATSPARRTVPQGAWPDLTNRSLNPVFLLRSELRHDLECLGQGLARALRRLDADAIKERR